MAVKYLCGTEALMKDLAITKSSSPLKREKREEGLKGEGAEAEQQRSVKSERI
jgi:hypothetical protein